MGVTGQVTATRAVTVEEIAAQLGETEQKPIRQLTRAVRIRCASGAVTGVGLVGIVFYSHHTSIKR